MWVSTHTFEHVIAIRTERVVTSRSLVLCLPSTSLCMFRSSTARQLWLISFLWPIDSTSGIGYSLFIISILRCVNTAGLVRSRYSYIVTSSVNFITKQGLLVEQPAPVDLRWTISNTYSKLLFGWLLHGMTPSNDVDWLEPLALSSTQARHNLYAGPWNIQSRARTICT